MEMPRADRLYVIVDENGEPKVWGEGDEYNLAVYADYQRATSDAEKGEGSLLTLTPDVLKAALEGPWVGSVTHLVYFPASYHGVQVSTERFAEVY
jgi:hypothetical protein